jgi:TRAP-type C4-dicarboxylate transport system permease small subunit
MKIYQFLAKFFLVTMVTVICIQVFFRYILDKSISWSEEFSLLLMVIFGFISIAIGVQKGLHLSISLFYNLFPPLVQKIFDKIVNFLVMSVGLIMVIFGIPLIESTSHAPMPATRLPAATVYYIIPLTGLLIAYYAFGDLIGHHRYTTDKGELAS